MKELSAVGGTIKYRFGYGGDSMARASLAYYR